MSLARLFGVGLHDPRNLAFLAAFAAVAGHIFPVWLRFRGGKGVATGLGSFLVLTPKTILLGLAIFILVLAAFRLVALASIVATASLPLMALWMGEKAKPAALLGAAALLIIVKHHANIARMLRGTEPKFRLRRRRTGCVIWIGVRGSPINCRIKSIEHCVKEHRMSKIAIIGAGAWGTGLSVVLGRKQRHEVTLWAYEKEVRESIARERINAAFLPEQKIPECVFVTGSLEEALHGAEMVVSAMPSLHCRRLFGEMRPFLRREMLVVSATKGLEQESLLRMTEVIGAVAGEIGAVGALSGPSFASEVARGDPTAITIASKDAALTAAVQREFGDSAFRVYASDDVVGVELGGALKNIIAIAAGVCHGLGLGHNSVAALITRGLAEITRLATACGGRAETMSGLAGLGDLVLTCTGGLSTEPQRGSGVGAGTEVGGDYCVDAWDGGGGSLHHRCGDAVGAGA